MERIFSISMVTLPSCPVKRVFVGSSSKLNRYTYDFKPGSQHPQLAEAHVKWGAGEAAIGLLHNHDIDGAR